MDMMDALSYTNEDPSTVLYKSLIAKHVALCEALVAKGVFSIAEMEYVTKREHYWLSAFDQLEAKRKEELLKAKTPEGITARLHEAFRAASIGGKFSWERFRSRYMEIRPEDPDESESEKS